jgi:hypothetical protein
MFSSTKDILFFVLSICVAGLTAFLCVLLYQWIKLFSKVNHAIEEVKEKIDDVHKTLKSGLGIFSLIGDFIKMGVDYMTNREPQNKIKTKIKNKE